MASPRALTSWERSGGGVTETLLDHAHGGVDDVVCGGVDQFRVDVDLDEVAAVDRSRENHFGVARAYVRAPRRGEQFQSPR